MKVGSLVESLFGQWVSNFDYSLTLGPQKGEICEVTEVLANSIALKEYPKPPGDEFATYAFRELQSPEEGTQIIEEINTQPVELCNNI